MPSPAIFPDLQSYAANIVANHNLPAVSLAVWKDNQLLRGAAGCLNFDTKVDATTDSIFQIGSITKVFTATLIMRLVDMGRIDLDEPVKKYLRTFELADRAAADMITVRQLLNHTNGIAGDYIFDDQNEDGPHIERLVYRSSHLPLVHPVGDGLSYSNIAFSIAGRIVEVAAGMSWYDAMEEWIFDPLGMKEAICRPAEVIRFRAALGHLAEPSEPHGWKTSSGRYLSMGHAPSGTTATMTAGDLIRFGRAHMKEARSRIGNSWLSDASIQLMQTHSVDFPTPDDFIKSSMGLGWMLGKHHQSGIEYANHSGGTNGQCSHLRVFPDRDAAIAVLMNCSKLETLNTICADLSEAVTGVNFTAPKKAPLEIPKPLSRAYSGHYRSYAGDYEIGDRDGEFSAIFVDAVSEESSVIYRLQYHGDQFFDQMNDDGVSAGVIRFMRLDEGGRPTRIFAGGRLFERID